MTQKVKQLLAILSSTIFFGFLNAQNIYTKDYGNRKNPAIIFIHGGPGGNSNLFEATTAKKLADCGFYVIVYDRRGEGRSIDGNATMTFRESFEDILQVYEIHGIKKATILGHSFGGIIATLFTNLYPEKVGSLVLAGALFNQQETYDHIFKKAKEHFREDTLKIIRISSLEKIDKNSAEYRKYCYEIAGELNYFNMPDPTMESQGLRAEYEKSEFYKTNFRNHESPIKFYKNETQNNLNNKPILKSIKRKRIPVFAVYGKNDGIFSEKQLSDLRKIVGKRNFKIIDNCSHYLFVDQQNEFLEFIYQSHK
ncbi:MAG: alpha/beta hydrolase [Breznakibacter sp.]